MEKAKKKKQQWSALCRTTVISNLFPGKDGAEKDQQASV